ncbi:hypothetical protein KIW84_010550 [Lathyrus oleraceus]|uniref:Uncharacterized protein n=1 Tax=Pisum sativum TaxID=3888 RepID=A0A9D5BE49_PEA|nr:hypothetical protein KIW84_010550 [Pisum sativum]
MKTPLSHEPAKYPSTLLSAVQCVILGFCMNWTSLLVLKAMSGRVRLKYWRLPTRARYSVGEGMRLPESLSNLYVADIGVDARPRCSAVGEAAFTQHEPFLVSPKGLVKNPFNWNREASMIYLDSPAGVGFSYSANTYDYIFLNDEFAVRVEEKTDCLIVVVLVWVDCSRLQLRDSPEAKGLTL